MNDLERQNAAESAALETTLRAEIAQSQINQTQKLAAEVTRIEQTQRAENDAILATLNTKLAEAQANNATELARVERECRNDGDEKATALKRDITALLVETAAQMAAKDEAIAALWAEVTRNNALLHEISLKPGVRLIKSGISRCGRYEVLYLPNALVWDLIAAGAVYSQHHLRENHNIAPWVPEELLKEALCQQDWCGHRGRFEAERDEA